MSDRRPGIPELRRLPFILLGAMTMASFGGPFAMLMVIRGGASDRWPPDRPVEWVTIVVVVTLVIVLFCACLTIGVWYRQPGSGSIAKGGAANATGGSKSGESVEAGRNKFPVEQSRS